MFRIIKQLHGGHSGGGGSDVKQSAPGSSAVATVDNAQTCVTGCPRPAAVGIRTRPAG